MAMEVLFAGVRVTDLGLAIGWYRRLFGRDPDLVPSTSEVMWRVADGGWLYVVEDPEHAGNSLVTICVDDLDGAVAELTARDLALGNVESVGDGARKAKSEDPDGNSIDLIEVSR